jgi:hypothetical protein
MKRYVIERDLPGVGRLSEKELNVVRKTSNEALSETGPGIQWVESFVTDDRIYCHYLADDEQTVEAHAKRAGIPATKVSEVRTVVDPLNATAQNGGRADAL